MTSAFGRLLNSARAFISQPADISVLTPPYPDRVGGYNMLRAYYDNNNLYDDLRRGLYEAGVWEENMMSLRNPASRVVEFYASHIWSGEVEEALEVVTDNDSIVEPIHQVWKWSNFGVRKVLIPRKTGIYGDMFMQVHETDAGHVCFHQVDPRYVTDFDTDYNGYITYIRMDMPILVRDGDSRTRKLWTEIWSEELGTYRQWMTDNLFFIPEEMGTPDQEISLEEMGIDFVPYVQFKFRDMDDEDGTAIGAFTGQIDKIDEVNRAATRLHEMLFRHDGVTWALEANATDPAGRPLPAPRMTRDAGVEGPNDSYFMGTDRLYRIPGNAKLRAIVPDLNYHAALEVVQDQMLELEHDLPELMYYRLTDFREVSGRAVQALLSPAIKRAEEVRGNLNHSIARANMMALTIGMASGIFPDMGNFDNGDLDHTFKQVDIIPLTRHEIAETDLVEAQVADSRIKVGVSRTTALKDMGYDYEAESKVKFEEDKTLFEHQQEIMPPVDPNAPPSPNQPPGAPPQNPNTPPRNPSPTPAATR